MVTVPSFSLIPHCVTMRRAIWVALWISFSAPEVMSPNTISSATRPPMMPAIWSISSSRETRYLSSSGRLSVQPSAMPREMIEILCTGSVCGSAFMTRAWPVSGQAMSSFARWATLEMGAVEGDVEVDAARAQQRRVQDVRAVGGCDHDHVRVGVEAVHLDQQLVEGLLALVVTTAQAGAALATDGVDLIHEHDAGRVFLRLVEEIADTAS